jgi:hypothetical protein
VSAQDDPIDARIAKLAMRQGRNVTRRQLFALGLDRNGIAYRVRIGRLHVVYRGVYSIGSRPVTAHEWAMAAVLACGEKSLLSDFSGLALWTFTRDWPAVPEVTTPHDRRPKGITVHRYKKLTRQDRTRQLGIPVTSPARTMLDCAPRLNERLDRVVHDALHTPWLKCSELAATCARHPTHPGTKLILPHATSVDGPSRSDWELDFPDWCVGEGLPRPRRNQYSSGRESDFLFVVERLIVELDSWESHSSRYAFESDRERDAANLEADIETLRLTWTRHHGAPQAEAARLRRILARRREYVSRG